MRGNPFLPRVHSTKAVKSARGPSSNDMSSRLLVAFGFVPLLQLEEEEFGPDEGDP